MKLHHIHAQLPPRTYKTPSLLPETLHTPRPSTMASLTKPTSTPPLSTSFSFTSRMVRNLNLNRSPRRPTISCKATGDHDNLHRRDVLLGLGGLYGLSTALPALSLPIQAPDLSQCSAADLPTGANPLNCCPPIPTTIIDYTLPPSSAPLRIRPAAHSASPEYIAKYTEAVKLMRALPDDDPRSFAQQARIHCAYCDGAYQQVGFPDLELQVHNSWLFFPWHRYYLHFHERILGSLIGDDTFALPFWNWDVPAGMTLPLMYTSTDSSLYDKLRNANHQPPTTINLNFNDDESAAPQIDDNLKLMYHQVISNGKTATLFMGSPYRAGDPADPGSGSFENAPHGPVHGWTGDPTQPNGEDMGTLYSAAFDPIFFAHHANIDRIWDVWRGLGGKRNNFNDQDWLNTEFIFYDEKAQLVRVKIRDCLDAEKMRFGYEEVELPWLTARPTPAKNRVSTLSALSSKKVVTGNKRTTTPTTTEFPITLKKAVSMTVKRLRVSRSRQEKDSEEEVLLVEGIELDRSVYVKFDVYIDLPEGFEGVTAAASEFAGCFVNVPHRHGVKGKKGHTIKTCLRMGICDLLDDLEAEGDESIVVTLVPRKGKVKIAGLSIEFST